MDEVKSAETELRQRLNSCGLDPDSSWRRSTSKTMTIGEHRIESSTSAKNLGVTFDSELGIDLHVKQHHSKLFLSAETAEIHPTITLHGCRKNTGPFSHIKSCRLLQQHFLRCHKHCCETTSICPQRGCQADLEQEEV